MPPKKNAPAPAPAATPAPKEGHVFQIIPHSRLRPSLANPRKVFKGLTELAASIGSLGLLEPILVRPVGDEFEIIAGERRWRAAALVPLEAVPCNVLAVDARGAFAVALEENGQRESLTPIEEAEAFAYGSHAYGMTPRDLAHRVGRTETYVRQRMSLTNLVEGFRDLLENDRLGIGSALALAAMPRAAQEEVARVHLEHWRSLDHAVTAGEVRNAVSHASRPLDRAPFDTTDATLNENAGPCGRCPKRSGRQGELFDAVGVDTCLDADCYTGKANAAHARRAQDANKRGLRVLSDAEAREVVRWGMVEPASEFAIAPAGVEPTAIAQCPNTLATVELVPAKVAKAAKKAARKAAVEEDTGGAAPMPDDPEAKARAERLELVRRVIGHVAVRVGTNAAPGDVARAMLERLGADEAAITRSVLGADVGEWLAREQPSGETVARMVAIVLVRSELRIGPDTPLDTTPPVFVALGVDLPEVVAELTAPAKKPAPAKKGGKKSTAKGARKKSAKAPKPVTQRKLGKKGGKR